MIKIIKHGITVLFTTPENVDCWDEQLAKVMFGYICEIHANIKFSPFMIMIGRTSHLRTHNYLHSLIVVIDDITDANNITEQFLQKRKLIASTHESVLFNVEPAQKKEKKTYATKKGKQAFEGLIIGLIMVQMKKPGKKKASTSSWEVYTNLLDM